MGSVKLGNMKLVFKLEILTYKLKRLRALDNGVKKNVSTVLQFKKKRRNKLKSIFYQTKKSILFKNIIVKHPFYLQ